MTDWTPATIVAGTDGSDGSRRAAAVAVGLARAHGATLHVVTVVRPPEGWWGVVGSPPSAESLADAMAKAQRDSLDATIESLDLDGVTWQGAEEIGDPAHGLMAYAEDNGADLIVVGKRGAGLIERLVVGSVADRLVHEAKLPVLVVP